MKTTMRPSASGASAYSKTYPGEPEAASSARRLVSAALRTWHLGFLDRSAALIVSELVTNALEHTQCQAIRVTVTRIAGDVVRVGVTDTDRTEPQPRAADPGDERGRGLAMVEAFADKWGVDLLPEGKQVWAELEIE